MGYPKIELPRNGQYIHLSEPKIFHDEITQTYKSVNKISVQINQMAETHIVQAIIDYARERGINDLFLIDEEFVKSALIHERDLRSPLYQKGVVKKPPTNFDRITESVESLADIMDNYRWCPYFCNSTCDSEIECIECIKEWLQKECEG
jgi:hypothetical protein